MHQTKPDPQLFHLKLKSLNMVLSETIALEDSINGVIAAKSDGLITKAVSNAVTSRFFFENADLTLSSLQEMKLGEIIDILKNKDMSG